MRFRYLEISAEVSVQEWLESHIYPHGHGFIAQTNMNAAGYCMLPEALQMVIILDSMGSRRDSMARRSNSGNSSKKRTQRCARLISHGRQTLPPQIMLVELDE